MAAARPNTSIAPAKGSLPKHEQTEREQGDKE
jgi:hypothetical protein